MSLDFLHDCTLVGPAFPEPFVRFELESELSKAGLLPKASGAEARLFEESWTIYRRKFREIVRGGSIRIRNHVIEPLIERLGYAHLEKARDVDTREGREDGGDLLVLADGSAHLRVWCTEFDEDLEAPSMRGSAYRYSRIRIAQRVLLACGERIGLLTNGTELRLLISDPARPDSQIVINIDPAWKDKRSFQAPDSYRLLIALASPRGVKAIPDLVEKARLQQTRVTKELRRQAREAVELFLQEVLDNRANQTKLVELRQQPQFAGELWREALVIVYRLLFILKLEATDDPARSFSFASTSLWRSTFSPSVALPGYVRSLLDRHMPTGSLLEQGLRGLFRMFVEGLDCTELHVRPLGGTLFGEKVTPLLSNLTWGEHAVAFLLDRLLWTSPKRVSGRERVHYGTLDVEDLGRVYEALLELDPGIATEPMCRLRRSKLEVVVPSAQGEKYRPAEAVPVTDSADESEDGPEEDESAEEENEESSRGRKTKVQWIEEIRPGRFYLRVGLGRKATGSYYTPHSFVRFLVQETLGPLVAERSPKNDPNPAEILKLKVLDPAMGSGHFLVEACRYLGATLYEAARLCDERLAEYDRIAGAAQSAQDKTLAEAEVTKYRERLESFVPPDAELLAYLPSRSPEANESGLSQKRAEAICRRLVAVHCLYGVDKNPLAVELAKVSLWIESHSEGLPLTFLDHRLVLGDSVTGPFFHHLLIYPGSKRPIEDLYTQGLPEKLTSALGEALTLVRNIESTLGASIGDVEVKESIRLRLEAALTPFKVVAAAWAGGVMLGLNGCDDEAYKSLVSTVAHTGQLPEDLSGQQRLLEMIACGLGCEAVPVNSDAITGLMERNEIIPAFAYDLSFPEVFFRTADIDSRSGFDVVLGNPPWDRMLPADKEFFAAFDFSILETSKRDRTTLQSRLLQDLGISESYRRYIRQFRGFERLRDILYAFQVVEVCGERTIGKQDAFRVFLERNAQLLGKVGLTGVVVPSGFHANEGATGVRQLYLTQMQLRVCLSFENRRQLFEIHRSFKFAAVVAARSGPTREFECGFYLQDDTSLSSDNRDRERLSYSLEFVQRTGGDYLSFLELRSHTDLIVARKCFESGHPFSSVCQRIGITLGRELNTSDDSDRLTATSEILAKNEDPRFPEEAERLLQLGYVVVHEGKTFGHFNDRWGPRPESLLPLPQLARRSVWVRNAKFYRLAFRKVARSTDERTLIACMLPPPWISVDSIYAELAPQDRPNAKALSLSGVCASFVADWASRQLVSANVNLFILNRVPLPENVPEQFVSHQALRLSSNHRGYENLWREQLGPVWREAGPPFIWPALKQDDLRWLVRATIDAVVADAYDLTRREYEHVLSCFNHHSYPKGESLCLQRFDELKSIGIEAFTRKYDPYWETPLNETLPHPIIDIPVPVAETSSQGTLNLTASESPDGNLSVRDSPVQSRNGKDPVEYEHLKRFLFERGKVGSGEVQAAFEMDAAQARTLLKKLVENGFATVEGHGRSTRYVSLMTAGGIDGNTTERVD